MYILDAKKEKVELEPLETELLIEDDTPIVALRGDTAGGRLGASSSLLTRASFAFFEMNRARPKADKLSPPTAFRDTNSGLLRTVYHEIVIRFTEKCTEKAQKDILAQYGFEVRRKNTQVKGQPQVVVAHPTHRYRGAELLEISNKWSESPEVIFATPNFVSQYQRQALPRVHKEQWHLKNTGKNGQIKGEDVKAQQAWGKSQGKGIVIAVLDDGVDIEHPALKGQIWQNPTANAKDKNGRDFFVPATHPEHFNPRPKVFQFPYDVMTGNDIHGTPCAGVIAAKGQGVLGIAFAAKILPVKIFHGDALASDERVANAIRYAASHADILSCSWSGGVSADIELALQDAGKLGRGGKGAAVFCAAGNDARKRVGFPASDPNAIAVGASTDEAKLASYSNSGKEIAFVAPSSGGIKGIFTTDVSYPNRGFNIGTSAQGGKDGRFTNDFGGTSSATPLAAGIGALVLSLAPNLTRQELKDLLQKSTDKIGDASSYDANGHSKEFGFGRLDAQKAATAALAIGGVRSKPKRRGSTPKPINKPKKAAKKVRPTKRKGKK